MDTRVNYAKIAKRVLAEYVDFSKHVDGESLRLVFDDHYHSYLVLSFGWWEKKYIHSTTIQVLW